MKKVNLFKVLVQNYNSLEIYKYKRVPINFGTLFYRIYYFFALGKAKFISKPPFGLFLAEIVPL